MNDTVKVTKQVILDLLPLYLAGEATPDTRALVEEYFRLHPEEAKELKELASRGEALLATPPPPPPPSLETETLARTRRYNAWRSQLLVFAIVYSLVPVYLVFRNGAFDWEPVLDHPKHAVMFLIAGLGCALARWILGWRLRREI
jgi:hypothetical protein